MNPALLRTGSDGPSEPAGFEAPAPERPHEVVDARHRVGEVGGAAADAAHDVGVAAGDAAVAQALRLRHRPLVLAGTAAAVVDLHQLDPGRRALALVVLEQAHARASGVGGGGD